MKIQFNFTPQKGHNLSDKLGDLIHNQDFIDYLSENAEVELYVEIKPKAKLSEKQMMYNYYHGVILAVAISALENIGWEGMNKIKADHVLKSQCAVGIMIKNGREHEYLEDKSRMPKKRLHKFITDCIFFLESELGCKVPSSEPFKNKEKYGYAFKSVGDLKPNKDF